MFAELDDIPTAYKKFLSIFELTHGILAQRLQSGLDVVGFYGISEGGEVPDEIAHLFDHEVTREIGIDLADLVKGREAMGYRREDAVGRFGEGSGPFLP